MSFWREVLRAFSWTMVQVCRSLRISFLRLMTTSSLDTCSVNKNTPHNIQSELDAQLWMIIFAFLWVSYLLLSLLSPNLISELAQSCYHFLLQASSRVHMSTWVTQALVGRSTATLRYKTNSEQNAKTNTVSQNSVNSHPCWIVLHYPPDHCQCYWWNTAAVF